MQPRAHAPSGFTKGRRMEGKKMPTKKKLYPHFEDVV